VIDLKSHRHWLEITPRKPTKLDDILHEGRGKLSDEVKKAVQKILGNVGTTVTMYLPITGKIPTISVAGNYEKLAPEELGLKQRLMLETFGGALGGGQDLLKELATMVEGAGGGVFGKAGGTLGKVIRKPAAILGKVSAFLQGFAGGLDSSKVWLNSALGGLSLTGTLSFDNVYEYRYFEAVLLVLQRMTVPERRGVRRELSKFVSMINKRRQEVGGSNLDMFQLGPPLADCECRIVSGRLPSPLNENTPQIEAIIPMDPDATDENVFLVWKKAILTGIEITHGSEEGKGINNLGESLLMTYNMSLEAKNLFEVINGFAEAHNQNETLKYSKLNDKTATQKIKDFATARVSGIEDRADIVRSVMYTLYNQKLTRTALSISAQRAIDLPKTVEEVGRLIVGGN
jgi:hypothetical protein